MSQGAVGKQRDVLFESRDGNLYSCDKTPISLAWGKTCPSDRAGGRSRGGTVPLIGPITQNFSKGSFHKVGEDAGGKWLNLR